MTDRFVVGTGRCGSTLLTRMLDAHDATLGLHEVFTGLDWDRRFAPGPVSGAEVAAVLGTPNQVVDTVIGKGYDADEVTYPFRPGDRYGRGEPIPWILTSTLGHLSDSPDELWDELCSWLEGRDDAPIVDHYRALFEHLAARSGKTVWVERSGSSVDYVGELLAVFDDPRVVHLHRDGPEVALSMYEHPFFRLAVQLEAGVVPPDTDPDDEDALIDACLRGQPDAALFGEYWSDQLERGEAALAALPVDRVLHVGFGDLVANPLEHLGRIADFLELPADTAFPARAAAMSRGAPPSRTAGLDAPTRERLDESCARGSAVLDRLLAS